MKNSVEELRERRDALKREQRSLAGRLLEAALAGDESEVARLLGRRQVLPLLTLGVERLTLLAEAEHIRAQIPALEAQQVRELLPALQQAESRLREAGDRRSRTAHWQADAQAVEAEFREATDAHDVVSRRMAGIAGSIKSLHERAAQLTARVTALEVELESLLGLRRPPEVDFDKPFVSSGLYPYPGDDAPAEPGQAPSTGSGQALVTRDEVARALEQVGARVLGQAAHRDR